MKTEYISFVEQIKNKLTEVQTDLDKYLDKSNIVRRPLPQIEGFAIIANDEHWEQDDEDQQRLQMTIIKKFNQWLENFDFLTNNISKRNERNIESAKKRLTDFIEKKDGWITPSSIEEAQKTVSKNFEEIFKILELYRKPTSEIILIPDTNAITIEPDFTKYASIAGANKFSVLILPTVVGELDNLKNHHRDENYRKKVKSALNRFKGFRNQGSLLKGVIINQTIKIRFEANEPNFKNTLPSLDYTVKDDRIIASILEVQREYPSDKIIFVTADLGAQIKAEKSLINFSEPPSDE